MKKGVILFAVKILITATLFWLIFQRIDVAQLLGLLRTISIPFVVVAGGLLLPNLYFHFASWRYVLGIAGVKVDKATIFESLLVGYTFALVTPGGLGEMGRGLYFEQQNRLHMMGLSFVQKFYSLLVTALLGMFGFMVFYFDIRAVAFALGAVLIIGLSCSPRLVGKTIYRLIPYLPLFQEEVRVFLRNLSGFYTRRAVVLLLFSTGGHLIAYLQYYLLFRAFGTTPPFLETLAAVAMIFFIKALLPISVGDLGLREGLTMYFFGQAAFGISSTIALNVSLLVFTFNLLLPSLVGGIFVHRIRWKMPPKRTDELV